MKGSFWWWPLSSDPLHSFEVQPCWTALRGPVTSILPVLKRGVSLHPAPPSPPLLANGATALLSGILRGCGRQRVGALVNAIANYAAGLPLMLLLAFRLRAGVAGLWWGVAAAAALQAAAMAALVSRFDGTREAARAAKLVRHLSTASMAASRPTSAATGAPLREGAGVEDDRPPAIWPPVL